MLDANDGDGTLVVLQAQGSGIVSVGVPSFVGTDDRVVRAAGCLRDADGASPRASIALAQAAKAHSYLRGRGYVIPEDVRAMALDVMRHRVLLTFEAEAEEIDSDQVVTRILDAVPVP